jgi:N-formylglutamate deformylase
MKRKIAAPIAIATALAPMTSAASLSIHGPAAPMLPLVLDSPHSGTVFPADFDAAVSEYEFRDGEYCFVDELYLPAS